MSDDAITFLLDDSEMPTHGYNIVAGLPTPPPPPLHPGTHQPVGPDDLAALFPPELIAQEVTTERYVEIPEAVREVYRQWRPSPLIRARRLERKLGTPAVSRSPRPSRWRRSRRTSSTPWARCSTTSCCTRV